MFPSSRCVLFFTPRVPNFPKSSLSKLVCAQYFTLFLLLLPVICCPGSLNEPSPLNRLHSRFLAFVSAPK